MSKPHDAARLTALGQQWIAAWNSRDLERVLALYAEDSEMTSDKIPLLGLDPSGTLHGKQRLREYWGLALQRLPNLHFDLIDVYVSPDSLVVFYTTNAAKRSANICASMPTAKSGRVRRTI